MREAIGIMDIEKLILLGDDVVKALQMSYDLYDETGVPIFEKYEYREKDKNIKVSQIIDEQRCETSILLHSMIRDRELKLDDVLIYTAEELLEGKLKVLITKAVGIFRNGTDMGSNDTNYYADDTVSDEFLASLFAMRVRDMMIVHACQRLEKFNYFLVLAVEQCHDGDEWYGIYDDIFELKKAYEGIQEDLKRESWITSENLMIYQFEVNKHNYKRVFPKELWGGGGDDDES
jgi:hypothetical protein